MDDLVVAWPPFGLELRCRDLVLRPAQDDDCVQLGRIVHRLLAPEDHHFMPRLVEGALRDSVEETTANVLRFVWRTRADLTPASWHLPLAVLYAGRVVGMQALGAERFTISREAGTGSYLDREVRGRGLGTAMRAMAVEFAFVHLGATTVTSGHMPGNAASRAVSDRLGYEPDGTATWVFRSTPLREQRLRLDATRWPVHRPHSLDELEVVGLPSVLPMLVGD